jgi:hypothetical protein
MSPRIVRTVFAALALGLAVHAVHAVIGPGDGPIDHAIASWDYTAVMWVGSAMCLLAAAVRRRERSAWAVIGIGLLFWAGGDLVWTLWLGNLENPPYPSVADGLYLGSYIAFYVGLLMLLRSRLRPIRTAQWLDGALGGLAAAAVVAALVFPALAGITEGDTIDVAFNLAYLVCDALQLTLIVMAFGLNRWRVDRSWLLLGLGQLANVVADSVFSYQSAVGTYVAGSWVDTLWPLGATLTAAADGRRSRAGRSTRSPAARCRSPPASLPSLSASSSSASSPLCTSPRRCWPPPPCSSPAPAAACSSARTSACCARAATSRSPTASPGWPTAAR